MAMGVAKQGGRAAVRCRNCGYTTVPVSGFCPRCLQPLRGRPVGWLAPLAIGLLALGVAALAATRFLPILPSTPAALSPTALPSVPTLSPPPGATPSAPVAVSPSPPVAVSPSPPVAVSPSPAAASASASLPSTGPVVRVPDTSTEDGVRYHLASERRRGPR
jgi:hypothetical protein